MTNQCASLTVYKRALQILDFNKRNFNMLELTTKVLGVTDITLISTLATACKQVVQAMCDMVAKPFDDAVVSNLFSSIADMKSACAHFELTPEDTHCDARNVLDIKALDDVTETIFRCVVACQSLPAKFQDIPRPLVVLDLAVFNIIYNAARVFDSSLTLSEDTHALTGKMPTSPIATFTKLEEQKYFNDEEREEIRRREELRECAEREARRKAEEARLEVEARDELLDRLCVQEDEREDLMYAVHISDEEFSWRHAALGIDFVVRSLAPESSRRSALLQMGLDVEEGELFCANGEVTPAELYYAAILLNAMNGVSCDRYKFVLSETCSCCDKENDKPLPISTLITYSKTE